MYTMGTIGGPELVGPEVGLNPILLTLPSKLDTASCDSETLDSDSASEILSKRVYPVVEPTDRGGEPAVPAQACWLTGTPL